MQMHPSKVDLISHRIVEWKIVGGESVGVMSTNAKPRRIRRSLTVSGVSEIEISKTPDVFSNKQNGPSKVSAEALDAVDIGPFGKQGMDMVTVQMDASGETFQDVRKRWEQEHSLQPMSTLPLKEMDVAGKRVTESDPNKTFHFCSVDHKGKKRPMGRSKSFQVSSRIRDPPKRENAFTRRHSASSNLSDGERRIAFDKKSEHRLGSYHSNLTALEIETWEEISSSALETKEGASTIAMDSEKTSMDDGDPIGLETSSAFHEGDIHGNCVLLDTNCQRIEESEEPERSDDDWRSVTFTTGAAEQLQMFSNTLPIDVVDHILFEDSEGEGREKSPEPKVLASAEDLENLAKKLPSWKKTFLRSRILERPSKSVETHETKKFRGFLIKTVAPRLQSGKLFIFECFKNVFL